jgi:hypothetical protein
LTPTTLSASPLKWLGVTFNVAIKSPPVEHR